MKISNQDDVTVASFGDEWSRLNQSDLSDDEKQRIFEDYFYLFPFDRIGAGSVGFDMGCGSGRWATLVAPRVAQLYCIDASPQAINVAKENLKEFTNVIYKVASVNETGMPDSFYDFGYSLGVLHHLPDTAAAIKACAGLLKPGSPFLLYLYFAFDNKPFWYKVLWQVSELFRSVINRMRPSLKAVSSNAFATFVYWPFARMAKCLEVLKLNVDSFPLAYYRDKSFYTMRTDARDRLGTPLEKRFTMDEIRTMLTDAGFENVVFSERRPYWVSIAIKK